MSTLSGNKAINAFTGFFNNTGRSLLNQENIIGTAGVSGGFLAGGYAGERNSPRHRTAGMIGGAFAGASVGAGATLVSSGIGHAMQGNWKKSGSSFGVAAISAGMAGLAGYMAW